MLAWYNRAAPAIEHAIQTAISHIVPPLDRHRKVNLRTDTGFIAGISSSPIGALPAWTAAVNVSAGELLWFIADQRDDTLDYIDEDPATYPQLESLLRLAEVNNLQTFDNKMPMDAKHLLQDLFANKSEDQIREIAAWTSFLPCNLNVIISSIAGMWDENGLLENPIPKINDPDGLLPTPGDRLENGKKNKDQWHASYAQNYASYQVIQKFFLFNIFAIHLSKLWMLSCPRTSAIINNWFASAQHCHSLELLNIQLMNRDLAVFPKTPDQLRCIQIGTQSIRHRCVSDSTLDCIDTPVLRDYHTFRLEALRQETAAGHAADRKISLEGVPHRIIQQQAQEAPPAPASSSSAHRPGSMTELEHSVAKFCKAEYTASR